MVEIERKISKHFMVMTFVMISQYKMAPASCCMRKLYTLVECEKTHSHTFRISHCTNSVLLQEYGSPFHNNERIPIPVTSENCTTLH